MAFAIGIEVDRVIPPMTTSILFFSINFWTFFPNFFEGLLMVVLIILIRL